jgi:hypothetical protein
MKSTTIAKTRHLVRLDEPGPPVPDGEGGWTEGSVPLNPPAWYCSIEAATAYGMEREIAGTVSATASHLLRGRFHPGISTTTRIFLTDLHRGGVERRFEVESVRTLDEAGVQLAVLAHEVLDPPAGTV